MRLIITNNHEVDPQPEPTKQLLVISLMILIVPLLLMAAEILTVEDLSVAYLIAWGGACLYATPFWIDIYQHRPKEKDPTYPGLRQIYITILFVICSPFSLFLCWSILRDQKS